MTADLWGRPAPIEPMQPWRSPEKAKCHTPMFSQKHGRKPEERLRGNSLFPASVNVSKTSSQKLNSGIIDTEEESMSTADMTRWRDPAYELRIEEMELLVEILNAYSCTCNLRKWFCLSPGVSGHVAVALQNPEDIQVST